MILLSVFYPNTEGCHFDQNYYLNHHIPLVKERLTPAGLVGAEIEAGLVGAASDSPPAYTIICRLKFDAPEQLQAAFAAHGPELVGDIPNFTNAQPVMQISSII